MSSPPMSLAGLLLLVACGGEGQVVQVQPQAAASHEGEVAVVAYDTQAVADEAERKGMAEQAAAIEAARRRGLELVQREEEKRQASKAAAARRRWHAVLLCCEELVVKVRRLQRWKRVLELERGAERVCLVTCGDGHLVDRRSGRRVTLAIARDSWTVELPASVVLAKRGGSWVAWSRDARTVRIIAIDEALGATCTH